MDRSHRNVPKEERRMQRAYLPKVRQASMRRTSREYKTSDDMDENTGTGDNMRWTSNDCFTAPCNKLERPDNIQGVDMNDIKEYANVLRKSNDRWLIDDTDDDIKSLGTYEYMALSAIHFTNNKHDRR